AGMLSFEEAREKVIAAVRGLRGPLAMETVELSRACGRVLAQPIAADRDYPPFDRSIRDGFALRADDAVSGATLRCIGEIKAGSGFDGVVGHHVAVFKRPAAAIPSTGDEAVDVSATPGPLQVRNGNSIALETLASLTGAETESLGNAPDEEKELRRRIERGLEVNLLIISGG